MNRYLVFIIPVFLFPSIISAQHYKKRPGSNLYQPNYIYYNFYNGVQMVEISYANSWQQKRSTPEAMQPTAIPWEAKNPMPPSSYIFRKKDGTITKAYLAHNENLLNTLSKPESVTTISHAHAAHKQEAIYEPAYRWEIMQNKSVNIATRVICTADVHYRYTVFSASGKMGLIDTLGNLILDTNYTQITCADSIYYFSFDYKTGIMSKDFTVLFPAEHDYISYFDKGLYCVSDYHYYGFVDKKGKPVTPVKYYGTPGHFKDGLLMVLEINPGIGTRWGFIDSTGNEVIPLKYESLQPFDKGLAIAEVGNKFGFIDKKGNTVIDFKYDYVQTFTNGFAKVNLNDKYGMINTKGEEVVPCEYTILENFYEGLAAASKASTGGPHIGYINTKNEAVIPFIYENAWPFEKGKAKVIKDGKVIYINSKGVELPARAK